MKSLALALGIALLAAGAAQAQQPPRWCAISQPYEIGYPFCGELGPAGYWGSTVIPADSQRPEMTAWYGPAVPVLYGDWGCDDGSARCAALVLDAARHKLMGYVLERHRDCAKPRDAAALCLSLAVGRAIWEIATEREGMAYDPRQAPRYPWKRWERRRDRRYVTLEGYIAAGFLDHDQVDRIVAVLDEGPGAELRECGLFVPMCQF